MKIKITAAAFLLIFSMGMLSMACPAENEEEPIEERPIENEPITEIILENESLDLTIGAREKLIYTTVPAGKENQLLWSSSNTAVAGVSGNGTVTATGFTSGGSDKYTSGAALGTAVITVKTEDGSIEKSITVNVTTAAQEDLMSVPPLKNQFNRYFLVGNIATRNDTDGKKITKQGLLRHFNMLTAENDMKPQNITNNRTGNTISWTWTNADNFVNGALESGFLVHGHTLLWHSQNAAWITAMGNANRDTALTVMKEYITAVVTRYRGKIYSWDVLNEVFPDGLGSTADWKTSMRQENPWFKAIGQEFVYEGFLAARLADPSAILYYNDFNTDNANKARVIANMVRDVNNLYKANYPGETRLLIDGIGMQEHHNTGVSAVNVKNALNQFRNLGVKISVTELDVLGQSWSEYSANTAPNLAANSTVTNQGLMNQAKLYGEYMQVYADNADIIERVSFWGLTDNQSWRSKGLPLLFDSDGKAKPAYYSVIKALD